MTTNGSLLINDQAANKLLDFSQKLDIPLLDSVVACMYNGNGEQQKTAQQILNLLKDHQDAWTRVDSILEFSQSQQTKYYALQILEQVIKTRWKVLPREQCEGIKKYIVALIIKTSSDPELAEREKVYLGKLNMILVQILKYEWPKNWPTFISDIVGASRTNESLCQNNMLVLKLLSEEVFDFSLGQMTQMKAKHLKDTMCNEFSQIFQLCQSVMESSKSASLAVTTLETLLKFLNWIPLGYIFETQLIPCLVNRFFEVAVFRNVTLKCLTEIAGISATQYEEQFVQLYALTLGGLQKMLSPDKPLREAYALGRDDEQKFIQNLALFLTTFLKEHANLLEKRSNMNQALLTGVQYLILISEVEETEIFKICLEYWQHLAQTLYNESQGTSQGSLVPGAALFMQRPAPNPALQARLDLYNPCLQKVRKIMISRMAKPEEVLVVENEQGEVVREFMKDTDAINMYKSMRETLVYLTHLNTIDTENIMTEKLQKQMDGTEWSWKNLNTLCWAIGSISGVMNEEEEKRFLVVVIKDLLSLVEQKRGKDNKAIIASDIMYIVGQYPRFLRAHWKFLKTVVNKLFEFMHETHEGVQDMACDTFIKIAHKCRRHFVTVQVGESQPFIEEILHNLTSIICDLQQQQVHTFYEAVGMMIAAETQESVQNRFIEKLFLLPNQVWDNIITQAAMNVDILREDEIVRQLCNILKTNIRACQSIGHPYITQLGRIYMDMLNVYKVTSVNINTAVSNYGEAATRQPLIKLMRAVKKDVLKLISNLVQKANDPQIVSDNILPPLLEAVLLDYQRNIPQAREPEVLSTLTTIITKLGSAITPRINEILDAVFQCTIEMISQDFEEYPEHRSNFFQMLQAVNQQCFMALQSLPIEVLKIVLDAIVWAFRHTLRNISELGLLTLHQMLINFNAMPVEHRERQQSFYQRHLLDLLQHLFQVITDSAHAANLSLQTQILAFMFRLVESGAVLVPLAPGLPPSAVPSAQLSETNMAYLQAFLCERLKNAFPHLNDAQIKVFVQGLFSFDQNINQLKEHLRDFLVQIREQSGNDLSDLYLEERETEIRQAADEKHRQQLLVPGLIGPNELQDNMED